MRNICFLILLLLLFITSQGLFIFAGYPNSTGSLGNSFEVTSENIWLYCALPFITGIILVSAALLIVIFVKKCILSSLIISSIMLAIMIAYTILLACISSPGWLGTYFNIASIGIDAITLLMLILYKFNKIPFLRNHQV